MKLKERFQSSWSIFLASVQLLRTQPRLLLFPLLSLLFVLVLTGFFLGLPLLSLLRVETGHAFYELAHWQSLLGPQFADRFIATYGSTTVTVAISLFCAVVYLVSMFATAFCNVAFYHQITRAFAGEDVSIRLGYRFACSRWVAILKWSMLAATIGLLIKYIAERTGIIGSLLMRFVGMVWSVATVFTIPILVREDCRQPVRLVRTSAALLRKTWGEALIGYVGMGLLSGLFVSLLLLLVLAGVFLMVAFKSVALFLSVLSLALVLLLVYALIMNAANDVFRCALYIFASEGEVPGPFDRAMLDAAWKMKKA